jgi:hypothetical protein
MALLELWKGSAARVTERRSYEWKIAFGVWTAQLVTLGELIAHNSDIHSRWPLFGVYLAGGVVVAALHAIYVGRFVSTRNKEDSNQAKYYEKEAAKLIIGKEFTLLPTSPKASKWSQIFEVGVTTVLAAIGPVAILAVTKP